MPSHHELPDQPPPSSSFKETLKEAVFYTAAGAAGVGTAVNKLRHSFYSEMKGKDGFKELRDVRRKAENELESSKLGVFSKFIGPHSEIQKKYQDDFDALLLERCGIHSEGLKGWTVGTYQRWTASGPHTRREVAFRLAEASIVTLGALMMMNHSQKLVQDTSAQENAPAR